MKLHSFEARCGEEGKDQAKKNIFWNYITYNLIGFVNSTMYLNDHGRLGLRKLGPVMIMIIIMKVISIAKSFSILHNLTRSRSADDRPW